LLIDAATPASAFANNASGSAASVHSKKSTLEIVGPLANRLQNILPFDAASDDDHPDRGGLREYLGKREEAF
jgi:hypothetical protein